MGYIFELIVLGKPVQIASGRLRQATCVLHHSTGAAAASANLLTGSRRSISDVVRVRMQSGMQNSKPKIVQRRYTLSTRNAHIKTYRNPRLNRVSV
jgi:hypothetical protein